MPSTDTAAAFQHLNNCSPIRPYSFLGSSLSSWSPSLCTIYYYISTLKCRGSRHTTIFSLSQIDILQSSSLLSELLSLLPNIKAIPNEYRNILGDGGRRERIMRRERRRRRRINLLFLSGSLYIYISYTYLLYCVSVCYNHRVISPLKTRIKYRSWYYILL